MGFNEIAKNWLIFLLEALAIILIVILVIHLIKWSRVLTKRIKALKKLKKVSKSMGYDYKCQGVLFLKSANKTSTAQIIIQSEQTSYNLRFLTAGGKNQILRFFANDRFIRTKVMGALFVNHKNIFSLAIARLFLPKGIPDDTIRWTHVETAEFFDYSIQIPKLQTESDGKEQKEIIIFNPVPLKAFYLEKTVWRELVGGEEFDGVEYHDIESFCNRLKRGQA